MLVFPNMEKLTNEKVNAMDWSTTLNYLKRSPVMVARQIDYVFKELCGEVILSVMHPLATFWILSTERSSKVEEIHSPIHIVDAPNIDKTECSVVVKFINMCHTCSFTCWNKICWNEQLSKESAYLPLHDHFYKVKRCSK